MTFFRPIGQGCVLPALDTEPTINDALDDLKVQGVRN